MAHNPASYGDRFADVYDEWYGDLGDEGDAVERLRSLAGDGPVLELGVGTGRLALPLAAAGVTVFGVDTSEAMLARLRSRPGGGAVHARGGDMAALGDLVPGPFAVVFVARNSLFLVPTQEGQVAVFAGAARRLAPGGVFVVEAFVPDAELLAGTPVPSVSRATDEEVVLHAVRHDPVAQRLDGQLVVLREEGTRLYPSSLRYAWPSELDLMARVAGLRLRERWGGWGADLFTAASAMHVSVYERRPSGGASRGR